MANKPHFTWDETLSVHVEVLDHQHQLFIDTLEKLYEAIMEKKSGEVVKDIIAKLYEYADLHFSTEEEYFLKFNYEDTDIHIAAHRSFKDKLDRYVQKINAGEEGILIGLMNYLEKWLVNHLNTMDKNYIKCFNENGLH